MKKLSKILTSLIPLVGFVTPAITLSSCSFDPDSDVTITFDAGNEGWFETEDVHKAFVTIKKGTTWVDVAYPTPSCVDGHSFEWWEIDGEQIPEVYVFTKNITVNAHYQSVIPVTDAFELETTTWNVTTFGTQQYFNTCDITWNGEGPITLGRAQDGDTNYIFCSDLYNFQTKHEPPTKMLGLPQSQKPSFNPSEPKPIRLTFAYGISAEKFIADFDMEFVWVDQTTSQTYSQKFTITLNWN